MHGGSLGNTVLEWDPARCLRRKPRIGVDGEEYARERSASFLSEAVVWFFFYSEWGRKPQGDSEWMCDVE